MVCPTVNQYQIFYLQILFERVDFSSISKQTIEWLCTKHIPKKKKTRIFDKKTPKSQILADLNISHTTLPYIE